MTTRTCRSCHQPFATAESIRTHKRDLICRPPDMLASLGWQRTPRGWLQPPIKTSPYASRKTLRRS